MSWNPLHINIFLNFARGKNSSIRSIRRVFLNFAPGKNCAIRSIREIFLNFARGKNSSIRSNRATLLIELYCQGLENKIVSFCKFRQKENKYIYGQIQTQQAQVAQAGAGRQATRSLGIETGSSQSQAGTPSHRRQPSQQHPRNLRVSQSVWASIG